jgi:hypothetical protein
VTCVVGSIPVVHVLALRASFAHGHVGEE